MLGGICLVVSFVFLTCAAWMWLAPLYSPLVAALVIGLGFLFLALLFLFIPVRPRIAVATPSGASGVSAMIEAFLAGRAAGKAMRDGD